MMYGDKEPTYNNKNKQFDHVMIQEEILINSLENSIGKLLEHQHENVLDYLLKCSSTTIPDVALEKSALESDNSTVTTTAIHQNGVQNIIINVMDEIALVLNQIASLDDLSNADPEYKFRIKERHKKRSEILLEWLKIHTLTPQILLILYLTSFQQKFIDVHHYQHFKLIVKVKQKLMKLETTGLLCMRALNSWSKSLENFQTLNFDDSTMDIQDKEDKENAKALASEMDEFPKNRNSITRAFIDFLKIEHQKVKTDSDKVLNLFNAAFCDDVNIEFYYESLFQLVSAMRALLQYHDDPHHRHTMFGPTNLNVNCIMLIKMMYPFCRNELELIQCWYSSRDLLSQESKTTANSDLEGIKSLSQSKETDHFYKLKKYFEKGIKHAEEILKELLCEISKLSIAVGSNEHALLKLQEWTETNESIHNALTDNFSNSSEELMVNKAQNIAADELSKIQTQLPLQHHLNQMHRVFTRAEEYGDKLCSDDSRPMKFWMEKIQSQMVSNIQYPPSEFI